MITKSELFWNLDSAEIIKKLETSAAGLTSSEAQKRLFFYGPNILKPKRKFFTFILVMAVIVISYIIVVEIAKKIFYKKMRY